MARSIPWDAIPEKNIFESGLYKFELKQIKELQNDDGILTYLGVFECEEPAEMSGVVQMERFQIGTDEDPEAQERLTWRKSRGAQNMQKLLAAAGVPKLEDDELTFEQAKGSRFVARMVKSTSAKDGQEYSNIRGYFSTTSPEAAQVGLTPSVGKLGNGAQRREAGTPTGNATVKCTECGMQFNHSEYGKHLMTHRAQPESQANQAQANPSPGS